MDCMNKTKIGDEKVYASALHDLGRRIEQFDKSLEMLGRTCLGTHQVVDSIEKNQRALEQQQQLAFARVEQQQHFMASNFQQMASTLRAFSETKDANSRAGLTEFDSMLSSRLQPLGRILENMQKEFGVHQSPRTPLQPDAIFKRLEQGYSDMRVQREVTTFVTSSSHKLDETSTGEDIGQEGLSAPPLAVRRRGPGTAQVNDGFREELRTLHRAELQMFLADLKKEQFEPLLGEIRKQELMLQPLSIKMEDLLQQAKPGLNHLPSPRKIEEIVGEINGPLRSSADIYTQKSGSGMVSTPNDLQDMPSLLLGEAQHDLVKDDGEHHEIELHEDTSLMSVFMYDEDIEAPPYNVENYYKKTGCAQALARSHDFQNLTIFVVCLNALWIGIDADWNHEANIYDADYVFIVFGQFFVAYFTFEWLIRLFAFQKMHDCWIDGWFKFDTFLVATMVLDVWILMPFLKVAYGKGSVALPTQPLRVIRLLKLTRMARLMRAFPELVTMVKGLFRAFRAIMSSLILIMLMVYIWAILLHMLLKDAEELNKKLNEEHAVDFATLPRAMWLLIIDGTLLLDGSSAVMTHLMFSKDFTILIAGIVFTGYACLAALLVLQMLIGVLCDVVAHVQEEQRNAADIGLVKQELLHKLHEIDNGDGKLTQPELMTVLSESKCKAVLKKLNINRLFLLQLQTMMFGGDPTSTVPIRTALDLMLLCRSQNHATVEALAGGFCYMSQQLQDLKSRMPVNQARFDKIEARDPGKTYI